MGEWFSSQTQAAQPAQQRCRPRRPRRRTSGLSEWGLSEWGLSEWGRPTALKNRGLSFRLRRHMAARRSPAAPTHGRAHASSGISKFFERRLEPSRQVLEKLGFELDDDQPRAGQTLQELDQAEDGDETIRYRRQS